MLSPSLSVSYFGFSYTPHLHELFLFIPFLSFNLAFNPSQMRATKKHPSSAAAHINPLLAREAAADQLPSAAEPSGRILSNSACACTPRQSMQSKQNAPTQPTLLGVWGALGISKRGNRWIVTSRWRALTGGEQFDWEEQFDFC